MNTKPALTLKNLKKSPKLGRVSRASDFLTKEQQAELHAANARGKRSKRKFDDVDAYVAEIMARFGYDAYQAWNNGEISADTMNRMLIAERAREKALLLPLENIIINMVGSCIRRAPKQRAPKGPKNAQKIIKDEAKIARGEM